MVEEVAKPCVPAQELVAEALAAEVRPRRRHALGFHDAVQVLDVALRQHAVEHQVAIDVEEVPLLGGQAVSHPPIVPVGAYEARTASMLSSILIFLPTSRPPLSSTTFQPRSQSSRLISVEAENPTRWSPNGLFSAPSNSVCSTTGLVTPLMVRSPATSHVPSSAGVTPVLLNTMLGCSSTWKKSGLRRCSSRLASADSTLATSTSTSTDDFSGASAIWISPPNLVKRPRTLARPRWRPTNSTELWDGSMVYVPGAGISRPSWVRTSCCVAVVDMRFLLRT